MVHCLFWVHTYSQSPSPTSERCGWRGFQRAARAVLTPSLGVHTTSVLSLYFDCGFWDGGGKKQKRKALIWSTVRAHVVLVMDDPTTLCAGSGVLHRFNHRHCNLSWESRVISAAHLSLPLSSLQQLLFFPFHSLPSKQNWTCLEGQIAVFCFSSSLKWSLSSGV